MDKLVEKSNRAKQRLRHERNKRLVEEIVEARKAAANRNKALESRLVMATKDLETTVVELKNRHESLVQALGVQSVNLLPLDTQPETLIEAYLSQSKLHSNLW